MGTLNIYNQGYKLWTKSDNQGNEWKKAEVSVTGNFDVSVEEIELQLYQYIIIESFKLLVNIIHQIFLSFEGQSNLFKV